MEEARLQEQSAAEDQQVTRERSDAFLDQFNKYLAGNVTATDAMVKAAQQMAQSGSFMAEAAATLPKEFVSVQADNVNLIDKNVNQVDNRVANNLHQHAHAHAHGNMPPQSQQTGSSLVPSRPKNPSDMHSTHYNKEIERLRLANGMGGKIYEQNSREKRNQALLPK